MNISETIAELKKQPGFTERVGMLLVHNGTVRAWSRADGRSVRAVRVVADREYIANICREYERRPGIYRVLVEVEDGEKQPGDDMLFIVVAGDVRENVKPVLSEVLDKIKSKGIQKTELPVASD